MSDSVSVEPTNEEMVMWVQSLLPIVDKLSFLSSDNRELNLTLIEMRNNAQKLLVGTYQAIRLVQRLSRQTPESCGERCTCLDGL